MGYAAGPAGKACTVLAAAILIFSPPAAAACTDPLAMRVEYGTAAFVQERHLSGVRAPLVSRGRATISAERVEWRVTEPMEIVTVIGAEGITQTIGDGPPQQLGAQGAQFVSTTGLVNLLTGDFDALRAHYDVARRPGEAGHWAVRLTPRAESLARFISQIEVRGCERVTDVEVRQANGDWMGITLSPIEG